MTKKTVSQIASLVLVLAVVFTVCGWIPFTAPVTINSDPEGASVYKDGELLGTTPFKTRVFHETKSFVVKMDGFFDQPVIVDYHSAEHISVDLRSLPVLVYSKPTAELFKVGETEPIGTTPLEMDTQKEACTYVLKAADYFDKEITIGIGSKSPVVIELEHKPVITITTTPADADIYMVGNDESLAKGSLTLILEEKAGFEIKADRYYPETVNLEPKTQTLNVTLNAMPYVMIASEPAGATVTIAGKAIGTTPVEQLIEKETVAELSLDGYITQTVNLDGKDLKPVITLEEVPPPPEPEPETNAAPVAVEAPAAQ